MACLNSDALDSLQSKVDAMKRQNNIPHGYPIATVTDLLDTIRQYRIMKKRYQRLSERRAQVIAEIFSLTSRSISDET